MVVEIEDVKKLLDSYFSLPNAQLTVTRVLNSGLIGIMRQLDEIIARLPKAEAKVEKEKEKEKEQEKKVIPPSELGRCLLQRIKKNPGITRTDLLKKLDSRRRGAEASEALLSLEALKLVHRQRRRRISGRPAECWFPKQSK